MKHERDHHPDLSIKFEDVVENAKEILLAEGKHEPTLIVEGADQTIGVLLENVPNTHEQRVRQMFAAGIAVAQRGEVGILMQVFFTTEAWMSTAEGGIIPAAPPSEDPNRREVLLVAQVRTSDFQMRYAVIEMIRDSAGHLRELQEFTPEGSSQERVENPLLIAFVAGFVEGMLWPPNTDSEILH